MTMTHMQAIGKALAWAGYASVHHDKTICGTDPDVVSSAISDFEDSLFPHDPSICFDRYLDAKKTYMVRWLHSFGYSVRLNPYVDPSNFKDTV